MKSMNDILGESVRLSAENEEHWKHVLSAVGRFSSLGFQNALLISKQKPDARTVASYSMWSKLGYYVKRGSKGILVKKNPEAGLNDHYLFDMADCGKKKDAKEFPDTGITEDELYDLCHRLHFQKYSHYILAPDEIEKNFQTAIGIFANKVEGNEKEKTKKAVQALMFNLTYGKIFSIVTSEKHVIEQIEHIKNAAMEEFPELLSKMEYQEHGFFENFVIGSSLYAVLDRYDMVDIEDFIGDSSLLKGTFGFAQFNPSDANYQSIRRFFSDHQLFYDLGDVVCSVTEKTKAVFREQLEEIKKERGVSHDRNSENERTGRDNRDNLQGSGRASVSGNRDDGGHTEEQSGIREAGKIRTDGGGIHEGELSAPLRMAVDRPDNRGRAAGSGKGSEGAHRQDGRELLEKAQGRSERGFHEDSTAEEHGTHDIGESSHRADHLSVSLNEQESDTEIRQLKDELPDFTSGQNDQKLESALSSEQYDFRNGMMGYLEMTGQINRAEYDIPEMKARGEVYIPHEYIEQTLLSGSGFHDGKKRILEMYEKPMEASERAAALKKEYGIGGSSGLSEGYGLCGYNTYNGKGIRIEWRDESGEKEGYISWKQVESEIRQLIADGKYQKDMEKENPEQSVSIPDEGNPEYFKYFYDYDMDKAEQYRSEHGYHQFWGAESQGLNGGTYVVYRDINDLPKHLREYAKKEEKKELEKEREEDFTSGQNVQKSDELFGIPFTYHHKEQEMPSAGKKTRFKWNMEAIRTLKTIESQNRYAYSSEQEVLARYCGWGGLSSAFDEKNPEWEKEYKELKELLTDDEYFAARSTVGDSFYTPQVICDMMADRIVEMGFDNGNVLEPSCGIGNFLDALHHSQDKNHTADSVNYYAVEIDDITSRIAKTLYPEFHIEHCGYEQTAFSDNFFDVVVGNVPFGSYHVNDPKYNRENFYIHDFFLAKSIDQVRPGGIVAVITSKGTLDKKNPTTRKYLAERAELIGAVRLPGKTFEAYAGTEVSCDILFFQKREKKISIEPDWVHLGVTEDGIPVNAYFESHPEMMLGKMKYDERIFGKDSNYTVCVNDDPEFDLKESLQRCFAQIAPDRELYENLEKTADSAENETEDEIVSIPADPDVKNFTFALVDGEIFYRENSRMKKVEVSDAQKQRMIGIIKIRELTRNLITIQKDGCTTEELQQTQNELNAVYDAFVKNYGYLTGRTNKAAFSDDGDYILLSALEEIDEEGRVTKAKMFTHQTIRPKQELLSVESAVEALQLSINEFGAVNLPFMLSVYEPDTSAYQTYINTESRQETLGQQITKQMGHNAQESEAELKLAVLLDELEGFIFLNPVKYDENHLQTGWETKDEYLSGNVREKLFLAKSKAKGNEIFNVNVDALEKVQPEWLSAADIDVRIGTTWIEPADYEAFIYELLNTPRRVRAVRSSYYQSGIMLHQNPLTGEYSIENKGLDRHSIFATQDYGTKRIDAYSIFEDTLNLRTVTVRDRIDDGDGKYHYEINQKETVLAREKQTLIKEKFKDWIFSDIERREKYENLYNERFNNIRLREFDGSNLTFPGMNSEIELLPHQKNAIARVILGGNTLLAHCVGAGKSFEMMASIMEQKRLGLIHKAVMVVPKALIGQTATEFLRLYPGANILVATEKDFSLKNRRRFVARIATGDYDCVIMSHSQYEKIPISKERRKAYLEKEKSNILASIAEAKENRAEKWTIKQMEKAAKELDVSLERLNDESTKDDLLTFEELGVDFVAVDEAHFFKNLAVFSKMSNVGGISSSGSKRASDMLLKCQYLNELSPGRGIVFATGTPVSNTMVEMYVMQKYLQPDLLNEMGLLHFDSWAANFGEVTTSLELAPEGNGFRFKNRFNHFVNLPELMTAFRQVADVQTADMLNLDVPAVRNGKPIIVEALPDDYTKGAMDNFVKRAERIRNGTVDPSEDNFLKITHEARLLGTDARLLDPLAPNHEDGKLNKVVENVVKEYELANEKGIIGCQLIFSDIGTPKMSWNPEWESQYLEKGFDIYNYLKTELVKRGIPAGEIAFVHDAKSDAAREQLFKEMRLGKKKIMIGSTDKCGTGVNVQTHLVAMHHVDCPWKPSSIEQREGRGIRQGNENEEVAIYRYVTKETFDAYLWGIVENKQRFISQVMTGKAISRTCEDIDEATLNYAEIKAIATGNPLIREKMELDNEVQKLVVLKTNHERSKYELQRKVMKDFPESICHRHWREYWQQHLSRSLGYSTGCGHHHSRRPRRSQ